MNRSWVARWVAALTTAGVVGSAAIVLAAPSAAEPSGGAANGRGYAYVALPKNFIPRQVTDDDTVLGVVVGGAQDSDGNYPAAAWTGSDPILLPRTHVSSDDHVSRSTFMSPTGLVIGSSHLTGYSTISGSYTKDDGTIGEIWTPGHYSDPPQTFTICPAESDTCVFRGISTPNTNGQFVQYHGAGQRPTLHNSSGVGVRSFDLDDVFTISDSSVAGDTLRPIGDGDYTADYWLEDLTSQARTALDIVPHSQSANGWLSGSKRVDGSQQWVLRSPAGQETVLPSGYQPGPIDNAGDVLLSSNNGGGQAVLFQGDTTPTTIASLLPSSVTDTPFVNGMSPSGEMVGYTSNQNPKDLRQTPFLLKRTATPPPVVNSTGDAAVKNGGKSGCDTGKTVTIDGTSKPECTLRAAIQTENAGSAGAKTITFALPSGGSGQITLASALPALTASGVTIDGTSGPGGSVTVDGSVLPQGASVLHVSGGNDTIQGIVPTTATIGILIDGSAGHDTVRACTLGVMPNSTQGTQLVLGVKVAGSPSATVGGTTTADRNVFGSLALGVLVLGAGASGATVQGNHFGTDPSGDDIPVSGGVSVVDASGVRIGGVASSPGAAPGNVFDGLSEGTTTEAGGPAVAVIGNSVTVSGTTVTGNLIGFHPDGTTAGSSHFLQGVLAGGRLSGTVIGGSGAGAGNVIAGASVAQLAVSGTQVARTQMLGNLLGTDVSGTKIMSGSVGIAIDAASTTTVGSSGAGRNVIAGGRYGIVTSPTSTPVLPGQAAVGSSTTPAPGTDGVSVTSSMGTVISGNVVGAGSDGTTVDADHVMNAGVALAGIGETLGPNNQIAFAKTGVNIANKSETVYGNVIGTNGDGTNALPNGVGVYVAADKSVTGMLVGGVPTVKIGVAGQKPNIISGNTTNLLLASPALVQGNLIGTVANGKSPIGDYSGTVPEEIAYGAGYKGLLAFVAADHSVIGGAQPGMGNVISGGPPASGSGTTAVPATGGLGVLASHVTVAGNYVGVGNDGVTAVPNAGYGIQLSGPGDDVVGAPAPGGPATTASAGGNLVANNGGGGIVVHANTHNVVMLSNQIHDNSGGAPGASGPGSGIVLSDQTSNSGIGAPSDLTAVQDAANNGAATDHTVVIGRASSSASTVQMYAAANCPTDPSDYTPGQGAKLLTTTTLNPKTLGSFTIAVPVQAVGTKLVATSTDSRGTSGFSSCAAVAPVAQGAAAKPTLAPGAPQTTTGTGFTPGEPVTGSVHSTPVSLGTKTADSAGKVTFAFTVPAGLERGRHYVVLTGTQTRRSVAVPFAVFVTASAPRSVRAAAGKASARVTWLAPSDNGGSTVTGYRVDRSTDARHWTLRAALRGGAFTDTHLAGGVRYHYRVTAINSAGSSPAGTTVTALPYTAPSAPRALHARAMHKAVTLRWSPPAASHGAPVTAYVVQYARCRIGRRGCHPTSRTTRARSVSIRLKPGRRYCFAVVAVNRGGTSPRSTVITARAKR